MNGQLEFEAGDRNGTAHIGVIIVAYNRAIEEIRALQDATTIAPTGAIRWLIVDNSAAPSDSDIPLGADYVWMGSNRGIAAAFNRGIEHFRDRVEYIAFFDQDTAGVDRYLSQISDRLHGTQVDVLMPLVTTDNLILSPCRRLGPLYRPLRSTGKLPKHFSCINSGMVVRSSLFETIRFDEELFLDFVDHKFVIDATAAGAHFVAAWDCRLEQDYSRATDTFEQAASRFRIFAKDARVFHTAKPFGRICVTIILTWRRLSASARYRTLFFFRSASTKG